MALEDIMHDVESAVRGFAAQNVARRVGSGIPAPPKIEVEDTTLEPGRTNLQMQNVNPRAEAFPGGGGVLPPPPACADCDMRHAHVVFRFYGSVTSDCFGEMITWDLTNSGDSNFMPCGSPLDLTISVSGAATCSGFDVIGTCGAQAGVRVSHSGHTLHASHGGFIQNAIGEGNHNCPTPPPASVGVGVLYDYTVDGSPGYTNAPVGTSWCDAIGNSYVLNGHVPINQFNVGACSACSGPHTDQTMTGDAFFEVTVTIT
jgi:hypothetical protein